MNKDEIEYKVYKTMTNENIATLAATTLCVGLVAIGTGSLHCLWCLLLLINLNSIKAK